MSRPPPGTTSALTRSRWSRASPRASKPGPRFALVAGTDTVTGPERKVVIAGRSPQSRGRGCRVDVRVHDRVDQVGEGRQGGVDVLEAVPGHRHDDPLAAVRRPRG